MRDAFVQHNLLSALLFTTAFVLLVGVQLDETLRKLTGGRARGIFLWL